VPRSPAAITPPIVRWWAAPLWPGSATAKPAKSITTSEGIGMHAALIAINAKIAGRPPSRTKSDIEFTRPSVTDAMRMPVASIPQR